MRGLYQIGYIVRKIPLTRDISRIQYWIYQYCLLTIDLTYSEFHHVFPD